MKEMKLIDGLFPGKTDSQRAANAAGAAVSSRLMSCSPWAAAPSTRCISSVRLMSSTFMYMVS